MYMRVTILALIPIINFLAAIPRLVIRATMTQLVYSHLLNELLNIIKLFKRGQQHVISFARDTANMEIHDMLLGLPVAIIFY